MKLPTSRTTNLSIILLIALALSVGCQKKKQVTDDHMTIEIPSSKDVQNLERVEHPGRYPEATATKPVEHEWFGNKFTDQYEWLEDEKAPEVVAWADAQDNFTRDYLSKLPHRDELKKRLEELLKLDSLSSPVRRGDRLFYSRRKADAEKRIYYYQDLKDKTEHLLLDPNTMSQDGSIAVGGVYPSWDGKYVAYSVKENNADQSTLRVMEVATLKDLPNDVINGARYARPNWLPNSSGFYYVGLPVDENGNAKEDLSSQLPGTAEVRFHALNTSQKDDLLIREASGDPKVFSAISLSIDGKWLFYQRQHGWNASDIYFTKISNPDKPLDTKKPIRWKTFVEGKPNLYYVSVFKDRVYLMTNDSAPRFKVLSTKMSEKTAFDDGKGWDTVVSEPQERKVIENFQVIGGKLVISYLDNVAGKLEVRDLDGKNVQPIPLEGFGTLSQLQGSPLYPELYYAYETILTPPTVFVSSVDDLKPKIYFQLDAPVTPDKYKVEQATFKSKDGTMIPMFIVSRKGVKLDGSAPAILYGYGGFGVSLEPFFRSSIYPWLEAGGVYAIVNLRGGGEFGTEWHKSGQGHNKQNVFDDFKAAANYLIDKGYTSPSKLAAYGGSNGGLLVGAAMTQYPELFGAIVCAVPLLDMIRYAQFGAGVTWVSEYGDPAKKEDFEVLYSYSPYHQLKDDVHYPALLMQSADHDDRVDPMHARKFVAKVQSGDSRNVALLRIERQAGHGGSDQISKYIESAVDMYSFLLQTLDPESSHSAKRVEAVEMEISE